MNDELKKYVQAYIDGEDVECKWDIRRASGLNHKWKSVRALAVFENSEFAFRIKPKAEDRWQRVIDEGYLCKFWA